MPTEPEPIWSHLDADSIIALHTDVYMLVRRRLHQGGKSPDEILELLSEQTRYQRLVRAVAMTVFGVEKPLDKLSCAELIGLRAHLCHEVEAAERGKPASTDYPDYPPGWRAALRRALPALGVFPGGKS
jgi:hypothetical protein